MKRESKGHLDPEALIASFTVSCSISYQQKTLDAIEGKRYAGLSLYDRLRIRLFKRELKKMKVPENKLKNYIDNVREGINTRYDKRVEGYIS